MQDTTTACCLCLEARGGSAAGGGAAAGLAWAVAMHPVDAARVQFVTGAPLQFTYRGVGWSIARASLATACYFAVFDQIHRRFAPP